jgi:putative flippase GtrA
MASLTSRVRAYRQSPHFTRLWKFASVSVISTIITQGVLFMTYHVLTLASAMECNVIATCVATVPAYYLNRTWTWGKRGKSHPWREVMPFWVIAFIGLVLSTVAVGVAAHNADHFSHSRDVRALVVQFANLSTYALIWVGRYVIFNRFLFGEQSSDGGGVAADESVASVAAAGSNGSMATASAQTIAGPDATLAAGEPERRF